MFLVIGLAAGLVWGLAAGGRLRGLAALPLRGAWLLAAAVALQTVVVYRGGPAAGLGLAVLLGLSHVALLGFVALNRRVAGMRAVGAGLLLNVAVMTANGGLMPISPETARVVSRSHLPVGTRVAGSKDVVLERSQTRLWPLSDVFVLGEGTRVRIVFSVGDVLIGAGAAYLVRTGMRAEGALDRLPA